MFRFVFYFYLVFFINPIFGATYFVTPNGSAQNNGQSEGNAWSFEHAVSMANAGDLINVKAGVYADLTLTFTKSGTANNLIHFRGYKSTPGDIQSHYSPTFKYGDSIDSNPMPVLRENRASNNEGQGMGMNVRGSYIRLENLLVQYYSHGVHIDSSQTGCHLKNIVCVDQGDYNVAHSYNPPSMPDAFQNYDGNGITARGTNHVFENIFVLNSGAQGFTLYDRGHTVNNSRIMCDNTVNPTDYYFLVSGVESTSTNIYVKRVGPLSHAGHGIVLKGNHVIERNLVDGFEIVNTNLEVQFPKTAFNVLRNGVVYKEANVNENNVDYAGINLANGAHHNVYQDIYVKNSMIRFTDWPDGLAGDVADSSDHNLFNRIIVDGGFAAIAFNYFHAGDFTTSADNNTFYNFVANDCNYLYENSRANSNTRLINFALRNVGGLEAKRGGSPGYTVDAQYSNGNFDNCGFSVQGQKLTTKSSLFEDPNNGKFALQENSELRGKGDATPFMAAGNDLGAIQSSITTTVQTTPTTTPATTPRPTATTPQVTQTLPSTTCLETSLATDLLVQRDDIDLSANQLRFSLRVSDIGDNDAVLCLAAVTSVAWSNCSVSVRARGGQFDALNADTYATLASAACTPNVDHMVTFSIDHEAQQYDVDVDGVTIAENFAFRTSAQKGPLRSMQLLSQRDYVNVACFLGSSSQQSTASTTAASTAQATTTGVETTPVIDPSATPPTTTGGAATTSTTEPTTTTSVTSTGTTASTPAVTLYEPNANCVDGALLCLCRGGECDDANAYCESNVPFAAGLCLQEVDTSCNGQVGCACVASDDGLKCLQGAVCASAANKSFCVREAQAETISMGSIVSANLLLIVVFQLFR